MLPSRLDRRSRLSTVSGRGSDQYLPRLDDRNQYTGPHPGVGIEPSTNFLDVPCLDEEHRTVAMPVNWSGQEHEAFWKRVHEIPMSVPAGLLAHRASFDPGRSVIRVHDEVRHDPVDNGGKRRSVSRLHSRQSSRPLDQSVLPRIPSEGRREDSVGDGHGRPGGGVRVVPNEPVGAGAQRPFDKSGSVRGRDAPLVRGRSS
jgi:hypothetical protein